MLMTQKQHMNPKDQGEDHRILSRLLNLLEEKLEQTKTPYMTPKRVRTEPELIGEKQQKNI